MLTIGQRLKLARFKAGMTQEELAAKVGTTSKSISLFETDVRDIKYSMLESILKALGYHIAIMDSVDYEELEYNHSLEKEEYDCMLEHKKIKSMVSKIQVEGHTDNNDSNEYCINCIIKFKKPIVAESINTIITGIELKQFSEKDIIDIMFIDEREIGVNFIPVPDALINKCVEYVINSDIKQTAYKN